LIIIRNKIWCALKEVILYQSMEIINIIANIFFIVSLLLKFAHALYLDYLDTKIAKIYGVHAGVPSSGAPFILRGGHKYQARFCIIAFLNFKKHRRRIGKRKGER